MDVIHRQEPKVIYVNNTKAVAWPYGQQDRNTELKVRWPVEVRYLLDSKFSDEQRDNNIDKLLSTKLKIYAHKKTRK